ncbi:MAG: ethanolamine utilization protein EutP [Candidatus Schekmanbacteria bacterium]|nr:ethanolamine utilization protein EutP [Candidatus Schekmanbacteria bacterium]
MSGERLALQPGKARTEPVAAPDGSIAPRDFIVVGAVGAGKSALFNALLGQSGAVLKTACLEYHDACTVDTPGEYFDNPRYYTALIATMSTIRTALYVHPANCFDLKLPPGLFRIYPMQVVGVISKIDLADADEARVRALLGELGITGEVFSTSIDRPDTIARLRQFLVGAR